MADIRHVSGHCWKCFYCAAWNASVD